MIGGRWQGVVPRAAPSGGGVAAGGTIRGVGLSTGPTCVPRRSAMGRAVARCRPLAARERAAGAKLWLARSPGPCGAACARAEAVGAAA